MVLFVCIETICGESTLNYGIFGTEHEYADALINFKNEMASHGVEVLVPSFKKEIVDNCKFADPVIASNFIESIDNVLMRICRSDFNNYWLVFPKYDSSSHDCLLIKLNRFACSEANMPADELSLKIIDHFIDHNEEIDLSTHQYLVDRIFNGDTPNQYGKYPYECKRDTPDEHDRSS